MSGHFSRSRASAVPLPVRERLFEPIDMDLGLLLMALEGFSRRRRRFR
jgi:hypothetical protein